MGSLMRSASLRRLLMIVELGFTDNKEPCCQSVIIKADQSTGEARASAEVTLTPISPENPTASGAMNEVITSLTREQMWVLRSRIIAYYLLKIITYKIVRWRPEPPYETPSPGFAKDRKRK